MNNSYEKEDTRVTLTDQLASSRRWLGRNDLATHRVPVGVDCQGTIVNYVETKKKRLTTATSAITSKLTQEFATCPLRLRLASWYTGEKWHHTFKVSHQSWKSLSDSC